MSEKVYNLKKFVNHLQDKYPKLTDQKLIDSAEKDVVQLNNQKVTSLYSYLKDSLFGEPPAEDIKFSHVEYSWLLGILKAKLPKVNISVYFSAYNFFK